jgi:hypothetical protein
VRKIIIISLLVASSCASYYQANYNFNQEFERGNLDKAWETLQANSSGARGKREFLYFVNNGLVLSMIGRYEESNEYLEKAFLFGEDYRINYLNEAASYLTNPNFTSYKGEDHEHLMLLYYKAINYLKMGNTDEALVECRRLNIRLQQLTDRYQDENKYQRDAFVHTLMGIIYEVDKDYNNAFIAYRNAIEIYKNDYERLFQVSAPRQLKEDLLRTAALSGMPAEFESYKVELGMEDYVYRPNPGGDVIYFWHDGLSPVKAEWGVNFAVSRSSNFVYFTNRELGFTFPFNIENYSEQDRKGLTSLQFFRVVFPKYIERPVYYATATLETNGNTYDLQLLENVNKIAFKCLQERMGLEFSKALIRVALKKSMEYSLKKEDKTMGAVLGLINAATEKADTRNWQTLPHSIYYSRVPVPEGTSTITLRVKGNGKPDALYPSQYEDVKKGQILFHTFSSLESDYPNYGY